MPVQLGAILVSTVVQTVVGSMADNIIKVGSSTEVNVDSLNTFLQLIKKDFSNQVEEIVRTAFLKHDLQELQRNALVAADAYKDFLAKPTEKRYLESAEESARHMYSRIIMLDKEMSEGNSDYDLGMLPEEDVKKLRLKATFLKLLIAACSLDLLIVSASQVDDKPDQKIKDRSKDYFQILERAMKCIKEPLAKDWNDYHKALVNAPEPWYAIMELIRDRLKERVKSTIDIFEHIDLKKIQKLMGMLREVSANSPTPFYQEPWWKEIMEQRKIATGLHNESKHSESVSASASMFRR